VNKKTAHLNAAQYDPTVIFANDLTNQTNVKQMKTRAPKLMGIEERLQDMDRMGVDIQAVCPAPYHYFYFTEPKLGAELARDVNHGIADLVAKHPDRFVGLGTVPLQNAELAVKELEYCVKKLGMRGVEICTNVNGMNLTDPRLGLEKFFAKANELGTVLFMHPLGYTQGERLTNHYFNNVIGNPLETTVAVSHLIFDGVVARNPKIKFIAAHGGGFIAHYWARMDHAWQARPDTRTVIKKKPSSYLEKFYFDTITFDPRMLKNLIDRYGADHVLLGTDYPYDMGEDDPLGLIASVKGLPATQRRMIEGLNAMKLLKIKA
jgi:aminocarboxymuconate-semialdehyde decarboxylase